MERESKSTAPKPFIFVLMPFDEKFSDIYKFGIKGAAEEVGAYAERVDEQIFSEGILDRVFNQINKADIVIADMTDRNPNVFYEVGYAHALGKIVLLLTQNADDIPFDLKHHQHTVYEGKIEILRTELTKKIAWAITESKRERTDDLNERYEVSINGIEVPENPPHSSIPIISRIVADGNRVPFTVVVRNGSPKMSNPISHIYIFSSPRSIFRFYNHANLQGAGLKLLEYFKAPPSDATDGLSKQYALQHSIKYLPPGAFDSFKFNVIAPVNIIQAFVVEETFRLRLHSENKIYDYPFRLEAQKEIDKQHRRKILQGGSDINI
jgi:nucleoside 2-deoxyribosyltransferase